MRPPLRVHRRKNKGRPGPAFEFNLKQKLRLLGGDRVLRGLGHAELHDGLSLDLDGFAGLRVASHASLAVRLHQTAEAGHYENAVLLGFFDSGVGQVLQKRRRGFVGELGFLGQMPNELCLGQTCSHVFPPRKNRFNTSAAYLIPASLWKNTLFYGGFIICKRGRGHFYRASGALASRSGPAMRTRGNRERRFHHGGTEARSKKKSEPASRKV